MKKQLSVIIPTYYRYKYLGNLLKQLQSQTVLPLEIIVIDQTPEADRPSGFYEQLGGSLVRLINHDIPSLTTPRNVAARAAIGDILLFLDDDIEISNNLIESHLQVMEREAVDVLTGAAIRKESLPKESQWDVTAMDPVRLFLASPNYEWEGMMIGVGSCNLSIKKEIFLAVGGFDENLPRMVDFELGYRLFRYGAKMYFSYKPYARHLRGEGGSRKNPGVNDQLVSALYIHKKHFPGWTTFQFILKNILGPYLRPWTLRTPIMPLVGCYRVIKANRRVSQCFKNSKLGQNHGKTEYHLPVNV